MLSASAATETSPASAAGIEVVLVSDAAEEEALVAARLRADGVPCRLSRVSDGPALARAAAAGADVVLCDDRRAGLDARAALRLLTEVAPDVPLVVLSGGADDRSVAELVGLGAADYVFRDRLATLGPAVARVAEQRRQLSERRRRERQTEALLATRFAGFYRSSPSGRILHANSALHRMFGYDTLEEFLEVDLATLYACPEERRRIVAAARAGQDIHELETQLRRRDGSLFWVSMTVRSVREAGRLVEFTGVIIDITDRRDAGDRLRRRIERQQALLDLSQVAVKSTGSGELFQAGAQVAALLASAPHGHGGTINAEDKTFILRATHGLFWDGVPEAPYRAPEWALDGRRTAAVVEDALALDKTLPELLTRHNVRSYVSVPIVAGDRPLGVLSALDTVPRQWDGEEVESLQLAADMLAVALERRRAAKERQSLFAQLAHAQEEERRTIAGEIHDDAVQVMAATNIRLELLRRKLVDPKQVQAARGLQETIEASIGRLRSLLFNLTPPDMESFGLAAAVRAQLEQLGIDENVRWTLEEGELGSEPDETVRIVLFRICQEALINTRKHAHARTVTVRLFRQDGGYGASIQDDGSGFDPAQVIRQPGHIGLVSMRERAATAGGWWRLTSSPGNGTLVETWLPERAAT